MDQKLHDLAAHGIADGASARDLLRLGRACDLVQVPAGTVVQREDEAARWCWAIVDGVAALSHGDQALSLVTRGAWVLDGLRLSPRVSATTMVAASDLELVVFGRREMRAALEQIPALARAVSWRQRG